MSTLTLTFQVSVEQIAEAIKQMSQTEMQRLFDLVPNLHSHSAAKPRESKTIEEIQASAEAFILNQVTVTQGK